MTSRGRKFVGGLALLALFLLWGFLSLAAGFFVLNVTNWLVRGAYYVIAGTGWLGFALPIVSFMSGGDDAPPAPPPAAP